jgi:hypothetical protein
MPHSMVGRTPWSAADAPVGLGGVIFLAGSGSGGTRADLGVRPTGSAAGVAGKQRRS